MKDNNYSTLFEKFPFLSYITYSDDEYIGIIQSMDKHVLSIYDYGALKTYDEKIEFIELGADWWNESSRLVPINIFLRVEWQKFRYTLKTFSVKDVKIIYGQGVNLTELATKRGKKRSITLVKRIPR